jgi:hypothetical protein
VRLRKSGDSGFINSDSSDFGMPGAAHGATASAANMPESPKLASSAMLLRLSRTTTSCPASARK